MLRDILVKIGSMLRDSFGEKTDPLERHTVVCLNMCPPPPWATRPTDQIITSLRVTDVLAPIHCQQFKLFSSFFNGSHKTRCKGKFEYLFLPALGGGSGVL